jgi:Myb-like DNA-binding domain.
MAWGGMPGIKKCGDYVKWTYEEHEYMLDLVKKHGTQWTYIAQMMTKKYGKIFRPEQCRSRYRMYPGKQEQEPVEYRETHEILPDGSHRSDKLIRMNSEQAKDVEFLLKAHGFDVNEWELVSARNNIWNVYSKQDGIQVLYSSKITVKPKKQAFDEYVLERIINRLPKIKIPKAKSKQDEEAPYLNIPLFDMHFGISDYEYYKSTQARILHFLEKPRKDVLFIIGQDLFHNNDFQGHTASGRDIERVDMEKAFEDAWKFYAPLIEAAIENSEQVHVFYSIGNHDEFAGWAFVKALEKRYSDQAVFDTRFKERKVHMLGKNFVGMNHSDKKKAIRLSENFSTEFPLEWSQATTRTIYVGHEHKEEVVQTVNDEGGVVIRRMPTGNKVDSWHDSMGFTTSHKRFEIQEYSETKLEAIYYV